MSQHPQFPSRHPVPREFSTAPLPSSSMPGLPGAQGVGMRGLRQYGLMSDHNQGATGFARDAQAFGGGQGPQQVTWAFGPNMLQNFMNDPSQPWTPLDQSLGQQLPMFTMYRSHPPPSETETTTNSVSNFDSGYRTESIYGEPDPNFDPSMFGMLAMGQESVASNDENQHRASQVHRAASTASLTRGYLCPVCKKLLKRNSELNKCVARHQKPFKCGVRNCSKGFANNNDLERHRRCVHGDYSGATAVYRCYLDLCSKRQKDWPRLDNFKQHLKRKHNVDIDRCDISRFMYRPAHSNEGPASSATAEQAPWIDTESAHISPSDLMSGEPGLHYASSVVSHHDQLVGESNAAASAAPESSYVIGTPQGGSLPLQEMGPMISGLRIPQPGLPDASISETQHAPTMNLSARGASDVLMQAQTPLSLPPSTTTQNVLLDVGHDIGARSAEARSESRQAESTVAGDMEVDGGPKEPASGSGNHDGTPEPDEPDNRSEFQPRFVGDAHTELLGAGQADFKELRSPSLSEDPSQSLDLDDVDDTKARAILKLLLKKGTLPEMLKEIGIPVPEDREAGDQKPSVGSSAIRDDGREFVCDFDGCPKRFPRLSELKKHERRHIKPYACTFPKCNQKFGSKSDWKRHENNQHVQRSVWVCEERRASQPGRLECGAVFEVRESFEDHLREGHKIHDLAVLDKKLVDYDIRRNFESRFWCGFCQKVIKADGPTHSKRFDHIDNHFNCRDGMPQADIKDWKHPMTPDNSHRKRGHSESVDPGPSKAKRHKDGNEKQSLWECCSCGMLWSKHTALACLHTECNHNRCDNCQNAEG
ncbi:hypothetical protein VTJ83DRAFT_7362 [Remersonia thermophila]|uniref:C2H2-type domain-containing protein n=1 Tax=Remersonia thermophila TaxID=72144 RepID=A0ABR4D3I7_9PEZI